MDVIVSEDQRILQDSTRRYLEDRESISALRHQVDAEDNYSRQRWQAGAAQGWVALLIPEAYGGFAESAGGIVDAAIIAEEMGRVVYPGPYLSNSVAAFALSHFASDAQCAALLPALASGEQCIAWCFAKPGVKGGAAPGGVSVNRRGDQFVLDGVAANVQDAPDSTHFLVTATDEQGVSQFLVPASASGIRIDTREALDLGRPLAAVEFSGVSVGAEALVGSYGESDAAFEQQLQLALVLLSAETVGVIDRTMEFTLDYVQQRYAFGRAIGSFQALKHRLADHAAQLEGAKAVVARAAIAAQTQAGDAAIAASIAKSHCGRFATEIIRDCLHMHGGIGMTWEHDIHFYLRRAVSNEALWGTPAVHHERLCQLAGL